MPTHLSAHTKAPVWIALVLAGLCALVLPEQASASVTYGTATGATNKELLPVNATADITIGSGTVGVTFHNLQTAISADNQNINGIIITFGNSSGLSNPVVSAQTATDITIDGTGTVTSSTSANPGWLATLSGLQLTLTTIGRNHAPETIIGPPDVGTGGVGSQYTHANNSIAGSNHNPFVLDTATFNVAISNLTATATIASVVFSFSTAAGDNVTGDPKGPATPEPSSLVLTGIGLAAFGIVRARARKRAREKAA